MNQYNNYFEDLEERYYSLLRNNFEKDISNAGDKEFVLIGYQRSLELNKRFFENGAEYETQLISGFKLYFKLNKKDVISNVLTALQQPEVKKKHLVHTITVLTNGKTIKKKELNITNPKEIVKFIIRYFSREKLRLLVKEDVDKLKLTEEKRIQILGRLSTLDQLYDDSKELGNNKILGEEIEQEGQFKVKGLPELNCADRFYIAQEMELLEPLEKISQQNKKHKLLAILIGCSIENAKKLFNRTYKPLVNMRKERKDELKQIMNELR